MDQCHSENIIGQDTTAQIETEEDKLRIGIAIRTWNDKGGIGVYTRNIVPNLLKVDQKNEYVLFCSNNVSLPAEISSYENAYKVEVPAGNKLIWDEITLPLYAHKEKVDIIFHTKFAIPLVTAAKTIMVLHGTERFFYNDFHPKSDRLFFRTVYPYYLKKASAIIAVSERARQDIVELMDIKAEKVRTVYLAVDPIFRVIKDQKYLKRIRESYHLPDRFILFAGHVYPGKNVGRLFKAFDRIRQQHAVKLVFAGDFRWKFKHDMDQIRKLKLNEFIQVTGHVPAEDLAGFYNLAELTVFPSYYESFGLTNVEANACGCPLITSKTGGSPEAAGEAAVYVDPLDVDSISDAMDRVLGDPGLRKDLIEKGLRNIKRFSWEKSAQQTLDTFAWLLNP
jgi:glycosyltransferase involved in cell wall biosynthesis